MSDQPDTAIAVTGMACRFPGAPDLSSFWRNLCEGKSAIERWSHDELIEAGGSHALFGTSGLVPTSAPIPDPYAFDAARFGLSVAAARQMDLQHRALVECAWTALEASGTLAAGRSAVGVFAGCSDPSIAVGLDAGDQSGLLAASLGASSDFLAARVAFTFDLHGPAVTVRAACATSLLAVHLAVQSLLAHECDVALAGGAAIRHPLRRGHVHEPGGIYSDDGTCRPYDKRGSGIVSGDGAGVVALRRLSDALAGGEPIHAVILGSAASNDGARKASFTAPSIVGQVEAMRAAFEFADVDPATVGFVEGHGTATPLGDPIEVEALRRAWRSGGTRRGPCWLGSVKSNIGHLDAAAGIAGFIKACLCVEHGRIPGTLNFTSPNPECALEGSPFRVTADHVAWNEDQPRRASVNSLGLGGTNVHVVLQERPPLSSGPAERVETPVVLTLSANRPDALPDYAAALSTVLREAVEDVAAAAETLHRARVEERFRASAVGGDAGSLAARLSAVRPPVRGIASPPRVALAFAGDGKRELDRVFRIAEHLPAAADVLDRAAFHLGARWQVDLHAAGRGGSSATRGILATSVAGGVAFYAALAALGIPGDIVLGQSLGDLAAAVVAELISLTEGLDLAMAREQAFRRVAPSGAIAVFCSPDDLRRRLPPGVELALVNSPYRCVVSGEHDSLARFASALAEDDIPTHPLDLISGVHCSLLDPVLDDFRATAAALAPRPPMRTLIGGADGTPIDQLIAADPDHWVRQLRQTVRFDECLRTAASGNLVVVDMSPTGSLGGAIHETVGTIVQAVIRLAPGDRETSAIDGFAMGIGALWEQGVAVDWSGWPRRRRHGVTLPVPPLARTVVPLAEDTRVDRAAVPASAASVGLWQRSWRRMAPAHAWERPRRIALLAFDGPWRSALASALSDAGHDVAPAATVDALDLVGAGDLIIDGRALGAGRDAAPTGEAIALAERLGAGGPESPRLIVATCGAFDASGSEALSPGAAALAAALLVAAQERPGLRLTIADLDDATVVGPLADLVTRQVGPNALIALRGGSVWRAVVERRAALADFDVEPVAGPCVITGGSGRFGRWLGRWLAEDGVSDLFLLGRTTDLSPTARDAVAAMRRTGANVRVIAADVTDPKRFRGVLDEALRACEEPLTVFHLAGDPHRPSAHAAIDEMVRDGMDAALAEQWAAKVGGALILRDWVRDHPASRCVIFSSNAGILGGPGLAAYSAANAAVDCLAAIARRHDGLDWRAIGWDGWRLPDDRFAAMPSALDAYALRGDEPFRALRAVMTLPGGHVAVAKGDFIERHRKWVETRGGWRTAEEPTTASLTGDGSATPDATTVLRLIWTEVLGAPADDDADLFESGGDSLNAMRIRSQIERRLGKRLTTRQVLRNASIAKLAVLIASETAEQDVDPVRLGGDETYAEEVLRGRL